MQRKIKSTEGNTYVISETTRLGRTTYDRNDPKAQEKIWVLHNTEGPAYIGADGKKEYYFWGLYQGNSAEVLKELKRNQVGLPPAKNPLFNGRM